MENPHTPCFDTLNGKWPKFNNLLISVYKFEFNNLFVNSSIDNFFPLSIHVVFPHIEETKHCFEGYRTGLSSHSDSIPLGIAKFSMEDDSALVIMKTRLMAYLLNSM